MPNWQRAIHFLLIFLGFGFGFFFLHRLLTGDAMTDELLPLAPLGVILSLVLVGLNVAKLIIKPKPYRFM